MTIKEVEEQTGLTRSNIRFYEREKLVEPTRNDKNGYRDYSESDVENIKKIAYLRTLEISIEDIRNIMSDKVSLAEIIRKQTAAIQTQIEGLNKAKSMCERMLIRRNIILCKFAAGNSCSVGSRDRSFLCQQDFHFSIPGSLHYYPHLAKTDHLCEMVDELSLWRACQGILIKLYVFRCTISRIVYYTVCAWGTKKYSGCFACRYSCTHWAIDHRS